MKIAVIGAGISGLSCAYRLSRDGHDVTLYEANDYFGGHTHTVDVTLEGKTAGVDTGFLVFNDRTYPNLVRLFDELGVESVATDMSFSVRLPGEGIEWAGTNLDTVFARRRNLLRPAFVRMLWDLLRFNREATALAISGAQAGAQESLGAFLDRRRYSSAFRDWYLLPMAGAIWSCPAHQMLDFPLASFVRFCHNHGLLQVSNRPQWRTVVGGAREYVERMIAAIPDARLATRVHGIARSGATVVVASSAGTHHYDHVVLAVHGDQALGMLADASSRERAVLGALRYERNHAVLHTDTRCLPAERKAWAAWNYQGAQADGRVCVHYLINRLQPLPFSTPVIVSLNPVDDIDPARVIGRYDYAHPVFDAATLWAQRGLGMIQGQRRTWFAGAWTGYGFHEDGLRSGYAVAGALAALGRMEGVQDHAQAELQRAAA